MLFAFLTILFSTTTISAIDWNGNNWALWCGFNGNDFTNATTKSNECAGRCASTQHCTHFNWTNHNGGTCWMKRNRISKSDAFAKYDQSAICGVIDDSSDSSQSGHSTRYWDCCKPSCSWKGKANVTRPVATCSANGYTVIDNNERSACNGGPAFTCNNNIPWTINSNLSYGFAAANIVGQSEYDWCCACYELTFTSGPVIGKKMVVQVTNTGDDLRENQFDIQIPGGGVGLFNGCKSQWGAPDKGWGNLCGGVRTKQECKQLLWQIRDGCRWRFQWFQNADNPDFNFVKVPCPQQITRRSGCVRY